MTYTKDERVIFVSNIPPNTKPEYLAIIFGRDKIKTVNIFNGVQYNINDKRIFFNARIEYYSRTDASKIMNRDNVIKLENNVLSTDYNPHNLKQYECFYRCVAINENRSLTVHKLPEKYHDRLFQMIKEVVSVESFCPVVRENHEPLIFIILKNYSDAIIVINKFNKMLIDDSKVMINFTQPKFGNSYSESTDYNSKKRKSEDVSNSMPSAEEDKMNIINILYNEYIDESEKYSINKSEKQLKKIHVLYEQYTNIFS